MKQYLFCLFTGVALFAAEPPAHENPQADEVLPAYSSFHNIDELLSMLFPSQKNCVSCLCMKA